MVTTASVTDRERPLGDIDNAEAIEHMVRTFYAKVTDDDLLGPMFNDVAKVDWLLHLPKLMAFWRRALLDQHGYEGNPFRAHSLVHAKRPFTRAHFDRWLSLFHTTLAEGWEGPNAAKAHQLVDNVARVHSAQLLKRAIPVDGVLDGD